MNTRLLGKLKRNLNNCYMFFQMLTFYGGVKDMKCVYGIAGLIRYWVPEKKDPS
jgi:hypothetical protein